MTMMTWVLTQWLRVGCISGSSILICPVLHIPIGGESLELCCHELQDLAKDGPRFLLPRSR